MILRFYEYLSETVLRQLPQSLFAKLAAGPPGKPAKFVCSQTQPPDGPAKYKPDME